MKRTTLRLLPIAAVTSVLWACGGSSNNSRPAAATPPAAAAPTLLVSRGVYDPNFSLSGQLPYNANGSATSGVTPAQSIFAVSPGTFPNVFTNDQNDANFGVTADAVIDQWAPGATSPSLYLDVTAAAQQAGVDFSTSFSSKSEFAMNVSQDGTAITFNGYNAPIDQIDRSNANTPGVVDPTNTDVASATFRTVGQLKLATKSLQFTQTNAYSGNNGRATVLANGQYYIVGNAGNSGGVTGNELTYGILDLLTQNTGVQTITAGSSCPFTQVVGQFYSGNSSTFTPAASGTCAPGTITDALAATTFSKKTNAGGNQFGFSLANVSGQVYDKTGKDDNFRGLYLAPNGTLYTSKGSGSNGINAVYQVGATGALAGGGTLPQTAQITIPSGFLPSGWTGAPAAANLVTSSTSGPQPPNSTLAGGVVYPFGMWMPANNTSLMFVADEGDLGTAAYAPNGSGGLWVYQNTSGTWTPIAHITQGLNLGQAYAVTDTNGTYGTAGASYTTTPDGLRNITGTVNSDGSITLYAITSTIGSTAANASGVTTPNAFFDEGADSNQLVTIKLSVSGSTVATSGFTVMQTAPYGQVLRGVALIPTTNGS